MFEGLFLDTVLHFSSQLCSQALAVLCLLDIPLPSEECRQGGFTAIVFKKKQSMASLIHSQILSKRIFTSVVVCDHLGVFLVATVIELARFFLGVYIRVECRFSYCDNFY